MRNKDRQRIKEKRILVYWQELTRLRIEPDASIEIIRYMFSIQERWIMEIIRRDISEYKDVELRHIDLEIQLIDAYAQKNIKQAQEARLVAVQGKLF